MEELNWQRLQGDLWLPRTGKQGWKNEDLEGCELNGTGNKML